MVLEHKGLYWSKVAGTEDAKRVEPSQDYILPLGKALKVLEANAEQIALGRTLTIVTYGMGIYWAKQAAEDFPGRIEIIDLRTLVPLDEELVFQSVKLHSRCIVLSEESITNSFAQALAHRITYNCFTSLDAPVEAIGALDLPAVPINLALEKEMLPNADKLRQRIQALLQE